MEARGFRQYAKQILAGALVVWLSGMVLLFCCGNMPARAGEVVSCPLAKAHHCPHQSGNKDVSQFAFLQTDSQMRDCCRVLPDIFDKARKVESNPQTPDVAGTVEISLPKFSIVEKKTGVPEIYRPPVLNRGGTYLKNRVLRI